MTKTVYKGHTLRVDGNLPEVYVDLFDHDLSEDTEKSFMVSSRLYVAARENHRRDEARKAAKDPAYEQDPDVKGKTVEDFRDEFDLGFATSGILNELLLRKVKPAAAEAADPSLPL